MVFVVDFDGTLVEIAWPRIGPWLPGAVESLHRLSKMGRVIVHTCRTAPVEPDTDDVPRLPSVVRDEKAAIRGLLDAEGLTEVEIWDKPWKPPAQFYIDDRAVRFEGNWREIMEGLERALHGSLSAPSNGHPGYLALLDEIKSLHVLKSGGYGTGADPFANFTGISSLTGQPRFVYPVLRMAEKLTRCLSLIAQGRFDELGEEFKDVASLALCAEAMRRADST